MFLDRGGDPYLSDDLFGNHHKELTGPFAPIIKPVTPQKVPSNNAYEPYSLDQCLSIIPVQFLLINLFHLAIVPIEHKPDGLPELDTHILMLIGQWTGGITTGIGSELYQFHIAHNPAILLVLVKDLS